VTDPIERLLAGRIGLDQSTVGVNLIDRGLKARMGRLGLRDRSAYEALLLRSEGEQQALVEEVVIPESWFFRDDRPFALLRDHARRGWAADPARPPLRALSLPCAGGEEPYSIAITLLEAGLPPSRFRVDAVDVSERSLERARAGVYGPNAFRGGRMPGGEGHFRPAQGGMEVGPEVRASVRFRPGNILDPALLAGESPYDVVFCRNLLIYFDPPARASAASALDRLLDGSGLLFLGHADRPSDLSCFETAGDKGGFAYRRCQARPPAPILPPPPPPPPAVARPSPKPIRPAVPASLPPPPPVTAPKSPAPPPSPGRLLEEASALADQGRYDEATRAGERAIRGGGPSAAAYFLLGMIRQAAGDRDRAESHFQRAVYLDAQHDEALLALALLARRRGDAAAEAGYRRRAERARSRKEAR
jgi:chemotaxis protein methyltransferase WspC